MSEAFKKMALTVKEIVESQLGKWRSDSTGATRAQGHINSIPFRIAEAIMAGGNSCSVMTFGEEDYDRPKTLWRHHNDCKPEWLKGAAKLVYDYCVSEELKVFISGGSVVVDFEPGHEVRVPFGAKLTFDIRLHWDKQQSLEMLQKGTE